jgi:tRNA dimethylallyltransferase
MSAVLYGLFTQKSKNKNIRERLYKEAKMQGKESLFNRLKKIDPQACVKIHPHDLRRIIRALEVYEETGIPISELQRRRKGIIDNYGVRIIGLSMDRAALYNKIERRVELMFEKGLIEEVKNLLRLSLSPTASMSIGIREIKAYLDGERSLEEAKRIIKRNTQYYAKKQLTWFKKDKNITWVKIKILETPQEVANRIWKRLYSSP